MRSVILLFLLISLSGIVNAATQIIKVLPAANAVVVPVSPMFEEGSTMVFFDGSKNRIGEGTVETCKKKTCLVKVTNLLSDKTIHEITDWKIPKNSKKHRRYASLSLGTPFGMGGSVAYGHSFKGWVLGGTLGMVSQTYDELPVQGYFASFDFTHKIFQTTKWFKTFFHLGYASFRNDLGKVSSGASDETRSALFFGAAPEVYYVVRTWEGFLRINVSYNLFDENLSASTGSSVNLPYAGLVVAPQLGIRKNF